MPTSKPSNGSGWFDSHCHLNDLSNLKEQLHAAIVAGVEYFLIPGTEYEQWMQTTAFQSERVFRACGTHPWFVKDPQLELDLLTQIFLSDPFVAVGEIGLDFYPHPSRPSKKLQLQSFKLQLEFAVSNKLPVIIHTVRAHQETLKMLKDFGVQEGVVHAFAGSSELALNYVSLGLKLGIGPQLLKSNKLRQAVQDVPLNAILLETDAPFMAIEKGGVNPLEDLIMVAHELAELRPESVEEIREATTRNAFKLFVDRN